MKSRWKYSCFLLLFLLLFPCTHAENVIRIGSISRFKVISPLATDNPEVFKILPLMYDELIRYDTTTGKIQNRLAEDIEWSEDHKKITMRLRKDIRFHDGRKFTAEDVVYSMNKRKELDNSPVYQYFDTVKSIKVTSPYKVELILEKPNASSAFYLDYMQLSPKCEPGEASPELGTGPFRLKEKHENMILLERNEDYFLNKPSIEQVRIISYENLAQLWAGLIKGEIDFSYFMWTEDYKQIQENPEFKTHKFLSSMCYMIAFNMEHEMFKDASLRKAMNFAVNKQELIKDCLEGLAFEARSPIYPESWAFKKDIGGFEYQPHKALGILQAAGWKDKDRDGILEKDDQKLRFSVLVDKGDTKKKRVIQHLALYLAEIGIEIKPEFVQREKLIKERLLTRNFQAVFVQMATRDPDFLYYFWHSSQIRGGFNCFSYRNERVDRALEEGRHTFEIEERRKAYGAFQEAFLEDPPGIFLFYPYSFYTARRNILGVPESDPDPLETIHRWSIKPESKNRGNL